jgi:phage tail-like protein
MASAEGAKDGLISSFFSLEITGKMVGAFREVTNLGSENAVVEDKSRGPDGKYIIKKIPGTLKWNDITLKQGITDNMDMWKWRKLVEEGKVSEARANGSIVMYDTAGQAVARWDLVNCWPSKLSGPAGKADGNEVAVQEMTLAHEGYERVQ